MKCDRSYVIGHRITAAVSLLLFAGWGFAQDQPATSAPAPQSQALDENADLLQLRCASLLDAVETVRAANATQAANTAQPAGGGDNLVPAEVKADAASAEDALVDVMLWSNGYLNGRAGGERNGVPLTRKWMADNVHTIAQRCAEDEARYVTDVVRSL